MTTAPRIGVGDHAPDFALEGNDGTSTGHRSYSLAELRGRPVVLAFYPADNSPVCTVQLAAYSSSIRDLQVGGAQVLGISPQSVESHDAFAAAHGGFAFPLLSDPDKVVGARYGILGPLGFYRRSIFVIDGAGVVTYAHRSVTSLGYQPVDVILEQVRKLG
jgi:peroxiredoxin Q/BCP